MADRQVPQTQESEIDPRLQEVAPTSQLYSNIPGVGSSSSHFRPPPPSPSQQQPHQHQQQYGPPQPWQQDGFSYYAPPGQQPSPVPHGQQHSMHAFQPYQHPSASQSQHPMQATHLEISDVKRSRACEACRNLKVKCEPNPEGGRCKRCSKAGRNCVTSAPSRKRQKKTDSRVADLEKRIDDLQRQMKSAKDGNISGSDDGNEPDGETSQIDTMGHRPILQPPYSSLPQASAWKRPFSEFESDGYSRAAPPNVHLLHNRRSATDAPFAVPEAHMGLIQFSSAPKQDDYNADTIAYDGEADVVGRGLLQPATANELFLRYTRFMAPHMPIVVFPHGTTSEDVRRSSPILFLAILSVASGEDYQDIQIKLNKEIMHTLAGRIIVSGEKSLELIQALQVVTIWYWREANGDSKYYQFLHMAATMAIDLRLNRRAEARKQSLAELQQSKSFVPDTGSLECRRAWLGCYLLASSIAMGMRLPNLVRRYPYNNYFEECITMLQQSKTSPDTDPKLCDLVRLMTFADDLAMKILPDDSASIPDDKVRSAHKAFEKEMNDWQERKSGIESLYMSLAFNVVNLYMYELAMQHVTSLDPGVNPRGRGRNQSQAAPSVKANSQTGLTYVLGILDTFSNFSVQDIRTLPIFSFAQIGHAIVSLIKMYFVAKADSEYNEHTPVTATMVEVHLSSLLESLGLSAADGKSLGAHSFFKVMATIQKLFKDYKDSSIESIRAHFSGIPRLKGAQILDLEEPQPTPLHRTASVRTDETTANNLHLLSAAAVEQANATGSEAGSKQLSGGPPEDGDMAAMGQLIGEGDMGFMSDEGFLGIMQTMFLKGVR